MWQGEAARRHTIPKREGDGCDTAVPGPVRDPGFVIKVAVGFGLGKSCQCQMEGSLVQDHLAVPPCCLTGPLL